MNSPLWAFIKEPGRVPKASVKHRIVSKSLSHVFKSPEEFLKSLKQDRKNHNESRRNLNPSGLSMKKSQLVRIMSRTVFRNLNQAKNIVLKWILEILRNAKNMFRCLEKFQTRFLSSLKDSHRILNPSTWTSERLECM